LRSSIFEEVCRICVEVRQGCKGVAIAAAMQAALTVSEYSPKKIKQSITGNGSTDKEQVCGKCCGGF